MQLEGAQIQEAYGWAAKPYDVLKLMWVDDELSETDERLKHFYNNNIAVEICRDGDYAKKRLNEQAFDGAVIDLLMPGIMGVDLISEIMHRELPVLPIVYSGYVSTDEVNNFELLKDNNIPYFDKNYTSGRELANAVNDILLKGPQSQQTKLLIDKNRNFHVRSILDYSYDEFKRLSQDDRYLLVLQAQKTLQDAINEKSKDGAVWFLYNGRASQPVVAYDHLSIPSPEEIDKLCRAKNIPTIQYYTNIDVDDLTWRDSCAANLRRYPLIGLKSTVTNIVRGVHFDTGSPVTLMDIEVVTGDYGIVIGENDELVPMKFNNELVRVFVKQGSFHLVDHKGRTPRISIRVHIPKAWKECPMQRRYCGPDCKRGDGVDGSTDDHPDAYGLRNRSESGEPICRYRWGLVGRNLLFEADLRFVLDGRQRRVWLLMDGEEG